MRASCRTIIAEIPHTTAIYEMPSLSVNGLYSMPSSKAAAIGPAMNGVRRSYFMYNPIALALD